MSAVVYYCQRLFLGFSIVVNLLLELSKDLFNFFHAKICLLNYAHVLVEVVLLDVFAEDLHVSLDFGEVLET